MHRTTPCATMAITDLMDAMKPLIQREYQATSAILNPASWADYYLFGVLSQQPPLRDLALALEAHNPKLRQLTV
ncbi:MAG: hypothetical protein ACFCBW_15330 [Candidatus Competibacterales bacterium]